MEGKLCARVCLCVCVCVRERERDREVVSTIGCQRSSSEVKMMLWASLVAQW